MKRKSLLLVVFLGLLACQDVERVYQQACEGGEMRGCYNLGVMYRTGTGVTQDLARAVSLYQEACDGGELEGCTNLGVMYRTGTGVAQDLARAVSLFRQACDNGHVQACSRE